MDNALRLYLGRHELEQVTEGTHIGNTISTSHDLFQFKNILDGMAIKTNSIQRLFPQLTTECKSTLFNTQCCSMYGCELLDIMSDQFTCMLVQWRKSVRYVLNLHPRTHRSLLPHCIESPNALGSILSRMSTFFKRGYSHENSLVEFIFKNCIINNSSYMCRNMHHISRQLNLPLHVVLDLPESSLKRKCKNIGVEEPGWREALVREMMRCRDGTLECGLSPDQINEILTEVCIG